MLAAVLAFAQFGAMGRTAASIRLETSERVGSVAVAGSWDGFAVSRPLSRKASPSAPPGTAMWARHVLLPCGEFQYHFIVDGAARYKKAGLWRRILLRRPKRYAVTAHACEPAT